MTSANSLSPILRRLDEIERKLNCILEELRPTAIGYSVRRGESSKEGLRPALLLPNIVAPIPLNFGCWTLRARA